MNKKVLIITLISISITAFAHEFWLQPNKYYLSKNDKLSVRFLVGENFTGENWKGNRKKVQQLIHYLPDNKQVDISNLLSESIEGDSLQLQLQQDGTHVIVFNSTNSFINLDAEKFNAYLLEDGLQQALAFRKANGEDKKNGTEYYQRCAKTIVQVNDKFTKNCTQKTSLTLDIVPDRNPCEEKYDMYLNKKVYDNRFRIFFKGSTVKQQLVKHWYKNREGTIVQKNLTTNNRGWISIEQQPGINMISCVYMERNSSDSIAKWQSYWGSLTFETNKGNFFKRTTGNYFKPNN